VDHGLLRARRDFAFHYDARNLHAFRSAQNLNRRGAQVEVAFQGSLCIGAPLREQGCGGNRDAERRSGQIRVEPGLRLDFVGIEAGSSREIGKLDAG